MIWVVLTEEGAGRHESLIATCVALRIGRLRPLSHLVEISHGPGHLLNHHLDRRRVECVRLVRFQWQEGKRIVDLLPSLSIDSCHDQIFLLGL